MASLPLANFLAGSILSLVLPLAVLIVIAVWYTLGLRRIPEPEPDAMLVGKPQPPAAGEAARPDSDPA